MRHWCWRTRSVIELLLDEQAPSLAELEEQTGKSIRLQPEALYLAGSVRRRADVTSGTIHS